MTDRTYTDETLSAFVDGELDLDEAGYVEVDDRTRTSVTGVFAAGDVMDTRYKQAISAAGT